MTMHAHALHRTSRAQRNDHGTEAARPERKIGTTSGHGNPLLLSINQFIPGKGTGWRTHTPKTTTSTCSRNHQAVKHKIGSNQGKKPMGNDGSGISVGRKRGRQRRGRRRRKQVEGRESAWGEEEEAPHPPAPPPTKQKTKWC